MKVMWWTKCILKYIVCYAFILNIIEGTYVNVTEHPVDAVPIPSGTPQCTTVPLTVVNTSASSPCCVPSAVHWVRLWVWHRVSSSGSAVLWHQRQAHPGSANTVEGELARGPLRVGDLWIWWHIAERRCMPSFYFYHMGTKKTHELELRGAGKRGDSYILDVTFKISM